MVCKILNGGKGSFNISFAGSDTSLNDDMCPDDLSEEAKSPDCSTTPTPTPGLTQLPPHPATHHPSQQLHHHHDIGQQFAGIKQEPHSQQIGLVST